MVASSRDYKVGGIRASRLVGVEANNHVVLSINQVLSLNPERSLAINGDASVHFEGVGDLSTPQVGRTVARSREGGVGQEVENSMQLFSKGVATANMVAVFIEVLHTTSG